MRTNRERLSEWIVDILAEHVGTEYDDYNKFVEDHMSEAREWADSIYHDINAGIIAPEVQPDPVDENGRRTGKASFYGDK